MPESRHGHPVIVGTLDTKGQEISFLAECFRAFGWPAKVIDVGVRGNTETEADVPRDIVAARAGTTIAALREKTGDKIEPIREMARGATEIISEWVAEGRVAGVIAIGGGVGTWVGASIMRALPFGLPKIIVSTLPYDPRPHIGASDIVVFPSIADILGLNPPLRTVLRNAAAALWGMASQKAEVMADKPVIGLTGMGITTPAVLAARRVLEDQGFEVASFHATGLGGRVFEEWVDRAMFPAVLDLTTHEITDQLFGGTGVTTEDRLLTAGRKGIPQVVAPGGIDIISRGPIETLSAVERKRQHYRHSPFFTHVRVPPAGMRRVASAMARRLNTARGPAAVVIPLRGFSDQDRKGGAVFNPEATGAFVETLTKRLKKNIRCVELDAHINDEEFAICACHLLRELMDRR